MKGSTGAQVWSLVAAFAVLVVMSGLWVVNLRVGPPLEGFTGGPMVIFVPFVLLALIVLWLAVRALAKGRIRWHAITVVVTAIALALASVVVTCGPIACFAPGPNRLAGWFIVCGLALAALAHHLVFESLSGESRHVA